MLKKIYAAVAVLAMSFGMVAVASDAALATTSRLGGQLNQDFGGTYNHGLSYNTTEFSSIDCGGWGEFTASTSSGNTVYSAGIEHPDDCNWSTSQLQVQKWVNGVLDTSFGASGLATFQLDTGSGGPEFTQLNDITIANDGELVLVGEIWDWDSYDGVGYGFALRISASGSNSISDPWGNSTGDSLDATGTLNLSAFANPEWANGDVGDWSEPELWFNQAVQYDTGDGVFWAMTGVSYDWDTDWDHGFVAGITDNGNLRTSEGDAYSGYTYIDQNFNNLGGINCSGTWSEAEGIVYSQDTQSLWITGDCDWNGGVLVELDRWTLSYTSYNEGDGYRWMNNLNWDEYNYDGNGWAPYLELSRISGTDYLKFGGEDWDGCVWTGTVDAGEIYSQSDSSNCNVYDGDWFNHTALVVDASGNSYVVGEGGNGTGWTDSWSVKFDASNTPDFLWGSTDGGVAWWGNCEDESARTAAWTPGHGLFIFGGAQQLSSSGSSDWAPFAANVFDAGGGTQTITPGNAPYFTDDVWADTAMVGEPYSDGVSATGSSPLTYIEDGDFPTGISLNTSTGAISGTPTVDESPWNQICVTNPWGSDWTDNQQLSVGTPNPPSYYDSSDYDETFVGSDYSWTLSADEGDGGTLTYSYTGDLPTGLNLDTETGEVWGIPTEQGDYYFTVIAHNSISPDAEIDIEIWVGSGFDDVAPGRPSWFTDTEIDGLESGVAVDYQIYVYGNYRPTCEITDGELPVGLELDSDTCTILGTPLFGGDYFFVVTATNNSGSYDFEYSGTTTGDSDSRLALILDLELGDIVEGADVALGGQGLQSESDWYAEFHSTPVQIANGVATIGGNFYFVAQLPSDIEPGEHQIILYGTDPSGNPVQTVTYITVGAGGELTYISEVAAESAQLPNTGLNSSSMALSWVISSALIALGALMIVIRRRLS